RNGQVVVMSGPKKEIVDDFSEEKITNAIIKVTRKEEKVVYFLQGHGERDINDTEAQGFSAARETIEKQNYQVKAYNLAQENELPEDATVIVSAGPKVDFFPNEEKLIREFLTSGGKFLLLVDPETEFDMSDFLAEYGLGLGQNVVIDASGLGQLFGLGAAAPLVAEYADHPITEELAGVMTFFPLAQNITTSESSLGYETVGLAKTSSRSWAEANLREGRASFDEGEDVEGPLDLAAVATHSAAEKSEETGKGEEEQESTDEEESSDREESSESVQREARFVLYGDSDFATNAYFDAGANGDLFLMTVSWLAEETDLIAIRAKDPENRRIEVTFSQSRLLFWGTVVLLPLATLVLGISVWYRRR
ncbi:MAG: GldG family protein, partial [Acidobacteriota bacterium]